MHTYSKLFISNFTFIIARAVHNHIRYFKNSAPICSRLLREYLYQCISSWVNRASIRKCSLEQLRYENVRF